MAVDEVQQLRRELVAKWRSRNGRESTSKVAKDVSGFLRKIILQEKHADVKELLISLKNNGKLLATMEPSELVIVNVVMMFSKLIKDEANKSRKEVSHSLNGLWSVDSGKQGKEVSIKNLKRELLSNIKELTAEIETCRDSVAEHSGDVISQQDVLLVQELASSHTLQAFLAHARRNTRHRVYSIMKNDEFEAAPEYTTPIQMKDIGSRMVEISKVVLSCSVVFPDGSCLVPAGGLAIALTAQKHNVPVFVLTAFYKITPHFIPDPQALNCRKPSNLDFSLSKKFRGKVEVIQPVFDIIPAQLVTLFISNSGCFIPAHVNKLKEDYYHSQEPF